MAILDKLQKLDVPFEQFMEEKDEVDDEKNNEEVNLSLQNKIIGR